MTGDQFWALIENGIIGKTELLHGVATNGRVEMAFSPEQVAAAARVGLSIPASGVPATGPLGVLQECQRILADAGADLDAAVRWCLTAHDELDGRTPADWAATGEQPERLPHVALKDAARLAKRTH